MKKELQTAIWLGGAFTFALPYAGLAHASQASDTSSKPIVVAQATSASPTSNADSSGAQSSAASSDSSPIPQVVVTAQFRRENLQDTPLSITAVTGASIRQRNLATVVDLSATSPSLEIRSGGEAYGPAPQIFIRGIGQVETTYAYEPGVGLYVDDVYYGSALGSVMDLLDLDRVEILRGPQGTLAGKNSVGGAIKLFSQKPTGSGHGYAEFGYGSFNLIEAKGSIDMPLVTDKLAVRISGMGRRRGGYLTRLDYACLHPGSGVPTAVVGTSCKLGTEGGIENEAARAALRWTPDEKLDINIIGAVTRDRSEESASKLLYSAFSSIIPSTFDQNNFITGPHSYTNYATYTSQAYTDPAKYNGLPGAGYHEATAVPPESHSNANTISGDIKYNLSDSVTLRSITAFQHMSGFFGKDIDLTPYGVNTIKYTFDHKQFTQEIRLNAQVGDLLDLTFGGFYFHAKNIFGGIQLNRPGTAHQNTFALDDHIKSTSKSGFAHADLHVTHRLDVTGGIRYTDDFKSYEFIRRNPYALAYPANASSGGLDGVVGKYTGNHVDYRGDINYRWSDQIMTYVQISTGYRGGGVNPRPYVPEQAVSFGPETITAYETGFKSDLLRDTLRVNGDLFLNKYKGIIFYDRSPTPNSTFNATPVNAGNGTFWGGELEVDYQPVSALLLKASADYLHFHLDSVSAAGATLGIVNLNAKAPNAPSMQFNFSGQYDFDAGDYGTITPRVDLTYRSSFYANIQNDPLAKTDARTLINARLTWKPVSGDWEVAFSVNNLLNKFYYYSKVHYPIGGVVGDLAPPREWKISVRRTF